MIDNFNTLIDLIVQKAQKKALAKGFKTIDEAFDNIIKNKKLETSSKKEQTRIKK